MSTFFKPLAALALWVWAIMSAGSVHAEEPKRFALLIGVDQYAQPANGGKVSNLRGPANDVQQMKALLMDKFGFTGNGDIVVLVGKQATVAAIESQFNQHLLKNARQYPGSTVLLYFSGHGSQTRDKDGDEGDGVDETLVAYDSRTAGKSDISDDTIDAWLSSLAPYTSNVTAIFDSCHSGDATKDISVTARSLPPNPNTDPGGISPKSSKGSAENDGLLPGSKGYAYISGSRAGELSNEGIILDRANASTYRGFLTHYLVTALRLDPTQTYEALVRRITPDIALHAPSQHPQAQGDVATRFLRVSDQQARPHLRIASVQDSRRFKLDAGAIHGIGPGTLVAVYAATARELVGESGKKANARVTRVDASTSQVELLDTPAQAITTNDKVAIVTPAASRYRMQVLTSALGSRPAATTDQAVLTSVRALLKDDHLVEQTGPDKALYTIQRGCMRGGAFTPPKRTAQSAKADCPPAYYVAARDNLDRPLFQTIATDADTRKVAQRLASVISLKARQDHLRKIENLASPLDGKLTLTLVKTQASGKAVDRSYPSSSVPRLAVGDKYEIQVTNNSEQDLYAAVLVLGSSGNTYLYGVSPNGELIKKKSTMRLKPGYTAGEPYGLETYKVLASTQPDVDYSVLVSTGTRRSKGLSAFDALLEDYSNANSKDPKPGTGVNLDEWTTRSIDTEIVP